MADNFAAQGGNTDADDKATEVIGDLIATAQPGSMVTRFIILAETIGPEGERFISSFTSQGLKMWESLGMLHFAISCEGKAHLEPDEDED